MNNWYGIYIFADFVLLRINDEFILKMIKENTDLYYTLID